MDEIRIIIRMIQGTLTKKTKKNSFSFCFFELVLYFFLVC